MTTAQIILNQIREQNPMILREWGASSFYEIDANEKHLGALLFIIKRRSNLNVEISLEFDDTYKVEISRFNFKNFQNKILYSNENILFYELIQAINIGLSK